MGHTTSQQLLSNFHIKPSVSSANITCFGKASRLNLEKFKKLKLSKYVIGVTEKLSYI